MKTNTDTNESPIINEKETIFWTCRQRALNKDGTKKFPSRDDVAKELSGKEINISAESLKKYETGKITPPPDKVRDLANLYCTPELKWMYCSELCPIGRETICIDDKIGEDNIYLTFYEIAGAFDKVDEIEKKIHSVINDNIISEDEIPAIKEALSVMDRIAENARDLRIWCEKAGVKV